MNIFQTVPTGKVPRSSFNRSHEVKLSTNMGRLTPILCEEVLPGDKFKVNSQVFLRCAPLIAPIMHQVNVFVHYFFVPTRLIYEDWPKFIENMGADNPYILPYLDTSVYPNVQALRGMLGSSSLWDYLGLPPMSDTSIKESVPRVSTLPFRAYQLIYNEYYRDQNLEQEFTVPVTGGAESWANIPRLMSLRYRCWEKDYFTSALPSPQSGDDVVLPLGDKAPVVLNTSDKGQLVRFGPNFAQGENALSGYSPDGNNPGLLSKAGTQGLTGAVLDPNGTLDADLSAATGISINSLRWYNKLQELLELKARGGSRYTEIIRAFFGVKPQDSRLQRPEYLGGGRAPISIGEVLQTSQSTDGSPQANMAGHGLAVSGKNAFSKYFPEHGFVLGIMSVVPRSSYQQGIPRMFMRQSPFDFYFRQFAHLGEQAIKQSELYNDFSKTTNVQDGEATFGYTPRYAEYKYSPSRVCGDFRNSLQFWHLGRVFANAPALNSTFVNTGGQIRQDIFAVDDSGATDKLWCDIYHNIKAVRPMPKYGVPRL